MRYAKIFKIMYSYATQRGARTNLPGPGLPNPASMLRELMGVSRSSQENKDNSVLITAQIRLGIGQQEAADQFGGF